MIIAIIILLALILILGSYTLTYSNKRIEIKIEYNGILWVSLDYWTIWQYNSDDIPMRVIKITKRLRNDD